MSERFLEESWQRTGNHEQLATREQEFVDLYYDVHEKSERDPELKQVLDRLDASITDYVHVVIENRKAWRAQQQGKADLSAQEGSDRRQQNAHNVLIDSLNQLSRAWRKKGLNNKWRNILGTSRNVVADWAITVGRLVMNMEIPA